MLFFEFDDGSSNQLDEVKFDFIHDEPMVGVALDQDIEGAGACIRHN